MRARLSSPCGDDDDDDGGGGGGVDPAAEIETLEPGTLIVGVDVPYPPLEQGRPPDYEGFEIELVDEIANQLGLEREYQDTGFDTIFRDLSMDKFDPASGRDHPPVSASGLSTSLTRTS